MMWIPVILICVTGSCEFLVGDVSWSANTCQQELIKFQAQLETMAIDAMGICIQIRVT
jgi:hypothetical protein